MVLATLTFDSFTRQYPVHHPVMIGNDLSFLF